MRRLIPAAILAVFLILVCISADMVTESSCNDVIELVEKYETAYFEEGRSELPKRAEDIFDMWESKRRLLSVFSPHDIIDKISYGTSRINGFAVTEADGSIAECTEIKCYLEQLKNEQKFSIECFY